LKNVLREIAKAKKRVEIRAFAVKGVRLDAVMAVQKIPQIKNAINKTLRHLNFGFD
jgi:hypothetical protein